MKNLIFCVLLTIAVVEANLVAGRRYLGSRDEDFGSSSSDVAARLLQPGYDHGAYRELYDGDGYGFGGPNMKRAFTLEDEDMSEEAMPPPMPGRRFYGGSSLSSSMGYANRQQTMVGMGGGMGGYPGYAGYGGYPGMYGSYPGYGGYGGYGGMGYPGYSGYGMGGGYPGMGMGGISPYMGGMGGMGSYGSSSSSSSGYQNSQSSNYGSMLRRNSGNNPCEGQACDEQKRRTNEAAAEGKDCDEKECKEVAMDENVKRRLEPITNNVNQQPQQPQQPQKNQILPFLNPQPPLGKPDGLPPLPSRRSNAPEEDEEKRRASGSSQTMIQIPMTDVKLAFILPPKLAGAMQM